MHNWRQIFSWKLNVFEVINVWDTSQRIQHNDETCVYIARVTGSFEVTLGFLTKAPAEPHGEGNSSTMYRTGGYFRKYTGVDAYYGYHRRLSDAIVSAREVAVGNNCHLIMTNDVSAVEEALEKSDNGEINE